MTTIPNHGWYIFFSVEDLITPAGATGAGGRLPATTRTGATVLPPPKCQRSSPKLRANQASLSRPCQRRIRFARTPRVCAAWCCCLTWDSYWSRWVSSSLYNFLNLCSCGEYLYQLLINHLFTCYPSSYKLGVILSTAVDGRKSYHILKVT